MVTFERRSLSTARNLALLRSGWEGPGRSKGCERECRHTAKASCLLSALVVFPLAEALNTKYAGRAGAPAALCVAKLPPRGRGIAPIPTTAQRAGPLLPFPLVGEWRGGGGEGGIEREPRVP